MARGKSHNPGWISGTDDRDDRPALKQALTLHHNAERRKPTDSDRPPPSRFPMTPAARAAIELRKGAEKL